MVDRPLLRAIKALSIIKGARASRADGPAPSYFKKIAPLLLRRARGGADDGAEQRGGSTILIFFKDDFVARPYLAWVSIWDRYNAGPVGGCCPL